MYMEEQGCAVMYSKEENQKTRIPGTEQEAMSVPFKWRLEKGTEVYWTLTLGLAVKV